MEQALTALNYYYPARIRYFTTRTYFGLESYRTQSLPLGFVFCIIPKTLLKTILITDLSLCPSAGEQGKNKSIAEQRVGAD